MLVGAERVGRHTLVLAVVRVVDVVDSQTPNRQHSKHARHFNSQYNNLLMEVGLLLLAVTGKQDDEITVMKISYNKNS